MPINCYKILASADIDKVQNAVESGMCVENLCNEVYKYDSFPVRIFVLFHCKLHEREVSSPIAALLHICTILSGFLSCIHNCLALEKIGKHCMHVATAFNKFILTFLPYLSRELYCAL